MTTTITKTARGQIVEIGPFGTLNDAGAYKANRNWKADAFSHKRAYFLRGATIPGEPKVPDYVNNDPRLPRKGFKPATPPESVRAALKKSVAAIPPTQRKPTGKADRDRLIKLNRKLDAAARKGEAAGLGGAARATNPFNWDADAALHTAWNDGWLKGNLAMHVAKGKGGKLAAKANGTPTKKGKTWLEPNFNAPTPDSAGPFKTIAQAAAHAQSRGWKVTVTSVGEKGDVRYILTSAKPAATAKAAVQKAVDKAIADGAPVVTEKAPAKAPAAAKGGRRKAKPVTLPVVNGGKSAPAPAPKNGKRREPLEGMTAKDIAKAMRMSRQTRLLDNQQDNGALDKNLRDFNWSFRSLWNKGVVLLFAYKVGDTLIYMTEVPGSGEVSTYEARWSMGDRVQMVTGKQRDIFAIEATFAAEILARDVERRAAK